MSLSRYKKNSLLTLLVVIVLVTLIAELPGTTLLWRELQNTAHSVVFAFVSVLVLVLLKEKRVNTAHPLRVYAAASIVSLFIGIGIELLQILTGGDASALDIIRDTAGIVLGLALYACCYEKHAGVAGQKKSIIAAMITSFIITVYPATVLSWNYLQRENALPVVLDLRDSWTSAFVRFNNASIYKVRDEFVELELKSGIYPGVSMIEPYPDWSNYEYLVLKVKSNNNGPVMLNLRVHDRDHNNDYSDRFNQKNVINKGHNEIRVSLTDIKFSPIGREMDMSEIADVTIFGKSKTDVVHVSLSEVNLQ